MDPEAAVRTYYEAIDAGAYDDLESALDPAFVQRRPDRTFEGRESFVRFMREGRPNPDTTHELEALVADASGNGDGTVAVRGRVLDDGADLFAFADFFTVAAGRIVRLETFVR